MLAPLTLLPRSALTSHPSLSLPAAQIIAPRAKDTESQLINSLKRHTRPRKEKLIYIGRGKWAASIETMEDHLPRWQLQRPTLWGFTRNLRLNCQEMKKTVIIWLSWFKILEKSPTNFGVEISVQLMQEQTLSLKLTTAILSWGSWTDFSHKYTLLIP